MRPAGGVIYPEQMANGQQLGTARSLVSHLSQCTNVNYQKLTADWIQIWNAIAFHARSQSNSQQPWVRSLQWTQAATFLSTRPFAKGTLPTATSTPHQGSSVSTGSCLWKHLFSHVKKRGIWTVCYDNKSYKLHVQFLSVASQTSRYSSERRGTGKHRGLQASES